jgi:regulator of replication initiation timing
VIEVEQKKFADLKNFKAAGLKKSEIKELGDELAAVREKIEAAMVEEHALGVEEERLRGAMRESIEEEEWLQRNLAISQYRYCAIKVGKINEYKEAISRNSAFSSREKDKLLR